MVLCHYHVDIELKTIIILEGSRMLRDFVLHNKIFTRSMPFGRHHQAPSTSSATLWLSGTLHITHHHVTLHSNLFMYMNPFPSQGNTTTACSSASGRLLPVPHCRMCSTPVCRYPPSHDNNAVGHSVRVEVGIVVNSIPGIQFDRRKRVC